MTGPTLDPALAEEAMRLLASDAMPQLPTDEARHLRTRCRAAVAAMDAARRPPSAMERLREALHHDWAKVRDAARDVLREHDEEREAPAAELLDAARRAVEAGGNRRTEQLGADLFDALADMENALEGAARPASPLLPGLRRALELPVSPAHISLPGWRVAIESYRGHIRTAIAREERGGGAE